MARYSHLPIWKAAMDLAVHLEHAVRRFPRYHKYSLGQDLRQCARRLCRLITRANEARMPQRAKVLDELVLTVEDMKTLLTLAQETRAFGSFNEFAVAADLAVSLGKQSGGWRQGAARKALRARRGPKLRPEMSRDAARAQVHCAPQPPGTCRV